MESETKSKNKEKRYEIQQKEKKKKINKVYYEIINKLKFIINIHEDSVSSARNNKLIIHYESSVKWFSLLNLNLFEKEMKEAQTENKS